MHPNSRGMNKAAVSQHGVSRRTNSDMPASKSQKRESEREAPAEVLLLHYKEELWKGPQGPQPSWHRISNPLTWAKSSTRAASDCVCAWEFEHIDIWKYWVESFCDMNIHEFKNRFKRFDFPNCLPPCSASWEGGTKISMNLQSDNKPDRRSLQRWFVVANTKQLQCYRPTGRGRVKRSCAGLVFSLL